MKKMYTKLLMLMAMMLVSNSLWAYTLPTGTMDLRTIKESSMGTWIDKVSYSLDDNYLIISGYASYKSANTDDKKGQAWITQTSAGNSANTWEEKEPFKGSGYYTTASYTTIQSGRNLVYRVKNCKSFSLYGKNNAAKKNLVINIFEVTDGKASTEAAYTLSNEETTEQVFSQTLDGDKEYVIDIEANGASNSRVFEVAFERSVVADTRLEPSLSISGTEFTATVGDTDFEEPTVSSSNGYKGSYSYSSDKPTVVSVDSSTGEVTICGVGTATITISTEENNASYKCRSITYTITVSKARPVGATFYESFDKFEGNGGNDDVWSGINVTPALGEFDNEGWTTEGTLYSGFQCVSIRKNSDTTKPSGVTTPAIGEEGNAVVSFMAEAWGSDGSNFFVDIVGDGTFAVSEGLEEGNISNEGKTAKVIMAKAGTWTTFTINAEGITADTKFRFYAPANKRAFLDEVVIYVSPAPEPKTYSLVGWINGADYGCEGDWENPGEYIFDEDGKLTVNFNEDSYVFVKTTDNNNWYLTESYVPCGEAGAQVTATMVNGKNYGEKMQVPGGYDIELTLTEKEDNTIELTYTMPTPPTEMVLVESELNDKIIEGGLIWNGRDADGNHVYVAVDAEGKLSTGYTEMILKGQPLYRATDGTATIISKEDGSKTLEATVTFNEIGTYHITGTYAPTEMVLSNNEIKESPSSSAITWEGRDADGNYVSVTVDAEGKLSVGSTAIFTYDFSAMYKATDGTATITTNEDGSKSLDAMVTFNEIGTYHITGTIAVPVPCPFGLPTVTATTEDITFEFDLTDAVKGKDTPQLDATIIVKKGEMEYTGGISEEDVVDGKVIKTISNSIFSAGFSSLALEAGDEITVTFPEATIWEKVDGSWNKAWTGEVEGSVTATVPVPEPTEKPLTNCGINDYTSMGGPVIFTGKDSDNNNVTVAIYPDGTMDMDITAIMLADLSTNITAESGTGTITTNADGSKSLDATVKFKDGNTYHITATIAAPAPCPFGLPTVTATTEEVVITFDLADAVEGVENPTLESINILINDKYHSGFSETDVVDGKVEVKIPFANFSDMEGKAPEFTEGQEITVTIPEVALYENYTAGGYETLYEGAMEGAVTVTVTTASGINTLSSASDNVVKYNLAGQRVRNAKGIIIVNGKKVAVK